MLCDEVSTEISKVGDMRHDHRLETEGRVAMGEDGGCDD